MIVRILGEGQYRLDDTASERLGPLDTKLGSAIDRGDTAEFREALNSALRVIHESGTLVPAETLEPSDLILPHEGASVDEVRKLLAEDGIILS